MKMHDMESSYGYGSTLPELIDRVLEKGLVINADISVAVAGVELLGLKIRAALASFETAAQYGLEFPFGTNLETEAWKAVARVRERCPKCHIKVPAQDLLYIGCPWCGWRSALAMREIEVPQSLSIKTTRSRRWPMNGKRDSR